MDMRIRNKLNVRQIAAITKPGVYSDGGGLYLRVRGTGSRSWLFIYAMRGKRREMGLGSDLDVTLAAAREKAAEARQMVLSGTDPQVARATTKAAAPEKPRPTFGEFALELIDSIQDGFKNPKHRQQWRNSLETYATQLFPLRVDSVTTEDILAALQPIWLTKQETASRVRGRIERILNAAKVKGLRSGENPARGRGHLDLLLPRRPKTEVKHHAALPFEDRTFFEVYFSQQGEHIDDAIVQQAVLDTINRRPPELPHDRYAISRAFHRIFDDLKNQIDSSAIDNVPVVNFILGPTGAGKTAFSKSLFTVCLSAFWKNAIVPSRVEFSKYRDTTVAALGTIHGDVDRAFLSYVRRCQLRDLLIYFFCSDTFTDEGKASAC